MSAPHTPPAAGGPPSDDVVARLVAFMERTSDYVGVADDVGNVIYANPATRARLGLGDDVRSLTTADLFPAASFGIYHDEIRPAILRDGVWSGMVPVHGEQGTTIEVWLTVVGEARPGGEIVWLVTSGRDITEWRRLAEELSWRATHDDLTGLGRRVLLDDRLDHALARARRDAGTVAVVFLDVDDLKQINDSFGHRAGDDVLIEVGRRIASAVRDVDTVARLGGDEFVVLFDGVDDEHEAAALAGRVRDAVVAAPVAIQGSTVQVSVSVGLASATGDVAAAELLRRADAAMYDAKRDRGRSSVTVADADGTRRRVTGGVPDLAAAVTRRLVVPHYQPVQDLRSGEIVGYQALARWHAMPAAEFIELLEGSGVGLSLDLAVLRQATADAASWQGTARPRVYAHVTSRFLAEPRMTTYLREALDRARLDPSLLAIEIPEPLLARRTAVFVKAVHELREVGVRLVVSDAGAHNVPIVELAEGLVDEVRLALSLVGHLGTDPSRTRAAAGVIALAHALGMTVGAVGVERAEQRDVLAEMGCDLIEGWLVGEVLPASEITGRYDTS